MNNSIKKLSKEPSFIIHSDIEVVQSLEKTDKLFKAGEMGFSTLQESYSKLSKKLNIK